MNKAGLNEFATKILEMANNPAHYPFENGSGTIFLLAKILDFDIMIDTNEIYETLWAEIYIFNIAKELSLSLLGYLSILFPFESIICNFSFSNLFNISTVALLNNSFISVPSLVFVSNKLLLLLIICLLISLIILVEYIKILYKKTKYIIRLQINILFHLHIIYYYQIKPAACTI